MDKTELQKLKVAELKEKLSAQGLPTTGTKDVLVQRLLDNVKDETSSNAKETKTETVPAPKETKAENGKENQSEDADKKAARAERFGPVKPAATNGDKEKTKAAPENAKAAAKPAPQYENGVRLSGDTEEDEKRRKRAERFGFQQGPASAPKTNTEGPDAKKAKV